MSSFARSSAVAFAALMLAVPAITQPALAQSEETASIAWVRGTLRGAIAPSSNWTDVQAGTEVRAGDTLKTVEDSAGELLLPSGARVILGASTILRLQDLEGLSPRVMTGRVRLSAPPRGVTYLAAGGFRMSGTDAEAIVERADGNWRIAVLAGSFRVVDAARPPMDIEAGKMLTFAGGQANLSSVSRSMWEDLQAGFQNDSTAARPTPNVSDAGQPSRNSGANNRWIATALSAVLPGAGQLYNGELTRGVGYLGLNFALIGTGFYGRFYGQNQLTTAAAIGLVGLNLISPLDAYFTTRESGLAGTRPSSDLGSLANSL